MSRKPPSALSVENIPLVHNNNDTEDTEYSAILETDIQNNSCNPKRRIVFVCISSVILIGLLIVIAYAFQIWPFEDDSGDDILFDPTTATINSIISAITREKDAISCIYIVESYIDRIKRYDKENNINSIISINRNVLRQAQELDNYYLNNNHTLKGKLHCIPLLIKDNIDVFDLITSGGIDIFNNNDTKAIENADIILKLIDIEGAILMGKTNMAPLSTDSHTTNSEVIGECHNPYSTQNRTCYGSSGGTAAAIASSFGVIGIGTDTVGSITLPSSGSNLFGVRAPSQILSMRGIMPSFKYSEVVGPMTKTLIDSAIIMDILMDTNISNQINDGSLIKYRNLTFGILSDMWTKIVIKDTPFEYIVDDNIFKIQQEIISNLGGDNVINISLNESETNMLLLSADYPNQCGNACYSDVWEEYLIFHGNYSNINSLINNNNTPNWFVQRLNNSLLFDCNSSCIYYFAERDELRDLFNNLYDKYNLDIIVFPGTPIPPFKLNETYKEDDIEWSGIGGIWPAYIGYPAINVPVQFTQPIKNDASLGLPGAILLMSKIKQFHKLFIAADGYQQIYGEKTKYPLL